MIWGYTYIFTQRAQKDGTGLWKKACAPHVSTRTGDDLFTYKDTQVFKDWSLMTHTHIHFKPLLWLSLSDKGSWNIGLHLRYLPVYLPGTPPIYFPPPFYVILVYSTHILSFFLFPALTEFFQVTLSHFSTSLIWHFFCVCVCLYQLHTCR